MYNEDERETREKAVAREKESLRELEYDAVSFHESEEGIVVKGEPDAEQFWRCMGLLSLSVVVGWSLPVGIVCTEFDRFCSTAALRCMMWEMFKCINFDLSEKSPNVDRTCANGFLMVLSALRDETRLQNTIRSHTNRFGHHLT